MTKKQKTAAAYATIAIGLVLAISAAALGFGMIANAGDADAVEASLTPNSNSASPLTISTPTTGPDTQEAAQSQLWQANPTSLLGAQSDAPLAPVWIRIDAISAAAPVNPYGINTRTGQMAVPNNVREVAWYQHGPPPGAPGSAVLAAHVDLKSQGPGTFFNLHQLDPGDGIVIGFEDGSEQKFVVEARTVYQKEDLPIESIFSREGTSVLTLITCGGGFSSTDESYDSNVVVYALPATVSTPGVAPSIGG